MSDVNFKIQDNTQVVHARITLCSVGGITVEIEQVEGGVNLIITDDKGEHVGFIADGKPGPQGEKGDKGEDGASVLTNNNKKLVYARRQAFGNSVYAALVDEDNAYNIIYGLPSGPSAGAYLKTSGTAQATAEWETPDTTPTQGSDKLITSGGVQAYVQSEIASQITAALAASY